MITHLVFMNFHDPEDAPRIAADLKSLEAKIPTLVTVDAGPNLVPSERTWDLGLVATFDDLEGLEAYRVHPAHVAVLEEIRRVASQTAAVDFES